MALAPFSPGGVQVRRTAEMFVQLRKQGVELERQLTTGKKANSFGELGFMRRSALDLRGKLSSLQGLQDTIKDADLRMKIMLQNVQGLGKIASDTRAQALLPSSGVPGLERAQAQGHLKLAIDQLNASINGRHLFSGTAHDVKPVADYETITAAVSLAVQNRAALDLGSPTGYLVSSSAGNSAQVTKPGGEPGGFTIIGGSSSSGDIAANPATGEFAVGAPPTAGTTISLRLGLPDGSEETITLTAVNGTAGKGQFQIGGTAGDTATNIAAAFGNSINELAQTALPGASALRGAQDYFADDENWYFGASAELPQTPRSSSTVRIDETQSLGTGAQANEDAFRTLLTQLAALSVADFGPTNQRAHDALLKRVATNLSPELSEQKISDIGIELGNAQAAMANAKERHQATALLLENSLSGIEDAPSEEVAAKLLALQTRLQASYQTTSLLSKLSLVNYLYE
jgi:flagellar hook-associated protein 3 FlgL